MISGSHLDLVVLVADRNLREVVDTLLSARVESLGIRPLRYDLLVHPRHDPGCANDAAGIVQPFASRVTHALVLLDHEGSGRERTRPGELEAEVRKDLARNGWGERAEVVVIEPELETWLWSRSPAVATAVGWTSPEHSLFQWLGTNGLWRADAAKPMRPREAMELVLRHTRVPRSSAVYRQIAARASLKRCNDDSFRRLTEVLRRWFAPDKQS